MKVWKEPDFGETVEKRQEVQLGWDGLKRGLRAWTRAANTGSSPMSQSALFKRQQINKQYTANRKQMIEGVGQWDITIWR